MQHGRRGGVGEREGGGGGGGGKIMNEIMKGNDGTASFPRLLLGVFYNKNKLNDFLSPNVNQICMLFYLKAREKKVEKQ